MGAWVLGDQGDELAFLVGCEQGVSSLPTWGQRVGSTSGPGLMPLVNGLAGDTQYAGDLGLGVVTGFEQGGGEHPTVVSFFRGVRVLGTFMPYGTAGDRFRRDPPQRSVLRVL